MSPAIARPIVLAVLTGLLYPLCFPDFDLGLLAWIVLVPLHIALEGTAGIGPLPLARVFRLGWLSGTIAFAGVMTWVVTAMHEFGKVPLGVSYLLMLLLAVYLGLFVAGYGVGYLLLKRKSDTWAPLGGACLWVALEWLRTYLFSGLPWALLGYSQYLALPIIQIADVTAVYGVSFLLVLVNASLAELTLWAIRTKRGPVPMNRPWMPVTLALAGVVASLLYGHWRLSQSEEIAARPTQTHVRVGLVQANIDQAHKWDAAYRRETIDRYLSLTDGLAQRVDLILWPEAATPFLFEQELGYRTEVTTLVRRMNVPLLFGSPTLRRYPNGRPYLHNSAYLLRADGSDGGRYDKRHLVPFGEYIPLKSSLLFFLDKLVEGIGDFEAGRDATVFSVPVRRGEGPAAAMARFGVVICYEVIFPGETRDFAARGANLMATITNDAWFGRSVAPAQHFGMVVFRAVENRRAVVRAANTGISGVIDPWGRILEATPIFEQRAVAGTAMLMTGETVYTRFGDVFALACAIIAGLWLGAALLVSPPPPPAAPPRP